MLGVLDLMTLLFDDLPKQKRRPQESILPRRFSLPLFLAYSNTSHLMLLCGKGYERTDQDSTKQQRAKKASLWCSWICPLPLSKSLRCVVIAGDGMTLLGHVDPEILTIGDLPSTPHYYYCRTACGFVSSGVLLFNSRFFSLHIYSLLIKV